MNNSDRQYYKKESDLPLSKRLAQEFICSPLLRRNGQPAKEIKRFGKNPDVNLLFDNEKPKVKTRRTEKLRRVIDLSDAIRKQIVRIDEKKLTSGDRVQKVLTKRAPRWTEKQNLTTISYFVEMDTKRLSTSASTKISPGSISDNSRIPEANAVSKLANWSIPKVSTKIQDGNTTIPEGSIASNIGNSKIKEANTRVPEASIISNMGNSKIPETSIVSNIGNSKIKTDSTRIPEASILSTLRPPRIPDGSTTIPEGSIASISGNSKIKEGNTRIPEASIISNMVNSKIPETSIVSNIGNSKIKAGNARIPEGSTVTNGGKSQIKAGSPKLPEASIVSNIGISKIQAGSTRIPERSLVSTTDNSKILAGSTRISEGGLGSTIDNSKLQAGSSKIPEANIVSTSNNPRIPDRSIVSSTTISSRIPTNIEMSRESFATTISQPITMEGEDEVDTKSELTTVDSPNELKTSSFEKLRKKMSSHFRLKGTELNHLIEKASERKFSKESMGSAKADMSSIMKTLSKLGVPLRRQLSEIDLNLLGENAASDPSMVRSALESYLDLPNTAKRTACVHPGWELGQHGHSVAASVLNKGIPEPCISSSSSSDDLFESTKYSRDIIEEKLRGLALEKEHGEEKSKELEEKKQMGKTKSKRKSKCYCRDKKNHISSHSKCSRRILPTTDGKFSVPTSGKDSAAYRDDSRTECGGSKGSSALSFSIKDNESEAGSQYQIPQDSKGKYTDSIGNLVDRQSDKSSSSDEEILRRPCDRDTCPSLNKNLPGEVDVTESQKLRRPSGELTKSRHPKVVEKLRSERSVLGEPTQSSMRLKSGVSSDVESSILSVRSEFCTQETCEFARNQTQKTNVDLFKHFKTSKSEHFYNTAKKKEICSPKICKLSGRRYKKLFSSKARKLKGRMKIRRWKRKYHDFICECHNVYVGNGDSDSDDLWSDKGLRRKGNRRYTMDHLKNRAIKKCGGYMTEGHRCNCHSCYIKEKPWKEFLKMPNVVLDIPYPLTTNELKLRAQNKNLLSKKLSNKYNWSEENLKNFCFRHEVCKKPNLRKSLLQENPFTSEWRWCHKNKVEKKVIKKEVPKENNKGRFGYFVKIKEERLTRGEHFTNIQKVIEKAVFCRWNLDAAEMKLNHFLENMPKQQTCYSQVKTFDSDRRTCYNPKLVKRLADMVNFNDEPDRKIHEFSFPPKMLKYQEPQLVGDIGTDMPEIRPVLESAKFPTIYRDLFKDQKRDLRKMMDTLLPPLQWTDNSGLWEMKVSIEPDNDETNNGMIKYLDFNETLCHAINKNFCAGRYRLYFEVFAEVIRQELIDNPERAFLLARIREEFLLTLLLYDGGLEMTLVGTTHLWKDIEADTFDIIEKGTLEKEIEEIQGQIKGVVAATYDLEKRVEEQSQTRDYQFKDQEKLYKRTNHQLGAQFENINAGLLYDLD